MPLGVWGGWRWQTIEMAAWIFWVTYQRSHQTWWLNANVGLLLKSASVLPVWFYILYLAMLIWRVNITIDLKVAPNRIHHFPTLTSFTHDKPSIIPQCFGSQNAVAHRLKYFLGKTTENKSCCLNLVTFLATYKWPYSCDSYTTVLLQADRMSANQLWNWMIPFLCLRTNVPDILQRIFWLTDNRFAITFQVNNDTCQPFSYLIVLLLCLFY